jgi:hypothetical protein
VFGARDIACHSPLEAYASNFPEELLYLIIPACGVLGRCPSVPDGNLI